MGTFLLLDAYSLAFRAWFALQEASLSTVSGQDTTAIYGFVQMTTRLLNDWQPVGLAAAFDRGEPTFRDEIAADYKAGRPPAPEAFHSQIGLIRQYLELLGVPVLEVPGYEADDVIATVVTRLRDAGEDVLVVSGDRDTYQLVEDPHVRVLYNRRGVTDYALYDEAGILERTGVPAHRYPLLAALRGDTSDNLPGVPGVGEKTAAKLVNTYQDLDDLFSRLPELTPKLRESLASAEPRVRQNYLLTPLIRDVPLDCDIPVDLRLGGWDEDGLLRLLDFLEMKGPRDRLFETLRKVVAAGTGTPALGGALTADLEPVEQLQVEHVAHPADPADAVELLRELAARRVAVVLEPEWSGLPGRSEPLALALLADLEGGGGPSDDPGEGQRVRLLSAIHLTGEHLAQASVIEALEAVLAPEAGGYVTHRAKELMRWLAFRTGRVVDGLDLDEGVAFYLVNPSEGQTPLEELAKRGDPTAFAAAAPAGTGVVQEQLGFELGGTEPAAAEVLDPAAALVERARIVAGLAPGLRAELEAAGASELYRQIERPLVRVLARMEHAGVAVDVAMLSSIYEELTSEAERLEADVQKLAGQSFNVNSTLQLRKILYEDLKLTPSKKTKTGASTDAASLEKLRDAHPIVDALLRYREVEKLRSTYGEGLLAEVVDGRIHASFNQTVARTGRLSSDRPNLHNIPVRTPEGRRFREAFIPAPGCQLLVVDYNQIELRVIAHLADDPGLVEAFTSGLDIHNATASRIFAVAPEEVTVAQRSKAKMVSYGLAYGMEAYGLSQRLSIPVDEAAVILDQYFVAFPAVRSYMDRTVAEARLRGYTETLFGRRRLIPELGSSNYRIRQAAERQAMNAGIQGLAADIFKVALVRLDRALEDGGLRSRIVLQVHDEVLVEVLEEEKDEVGKLTLAVMRGACELRVPLEVNAAWGSSWGAAKGA